MISRVWRAVRKDCPSDLAELPRRNRQTNLPATQSSSSTHPPLVHRRSCSADDVRRRCEWIRRKLETNRMMWASPTSRPVMAFGSRRASMLFPRCQDHRQRHSRVSLTPLLRQNPRSSSFLLIPLQTLLENSPTNNRDPPPRHQMQFPLLAHQNRVRLDKVAVVDREFSVGERLALEVRLGLRAWEWRGEGVSECRTTRNWSCESSVRACSRPSPEEAPRRRQLAAGGNANAQRTSQRQSRP